MIDVTVIETTVFARETWGGNPCPVIGQADGLNDSQMQEIAARLGHETAFVLTPTDKSCSIRLRFFVPQQEMTMCVHATIAVATWLYQSGQVMGSHLDVQTPLGRRAIFFEDNELVPRVWVEQWLPTIRPESPSREELCRVLKISDRMIHPQWPIETVSTSRFKTLVPLINTQVLDELKPHWEALWDLCTIYQSTGIYPFAPVSLDNGLFAARQFPVRAGYPEDPATGVAASALSGYLVRHQIIAAKCGQRARMRIHQGDAMGRPSVIEAEVQLDDQGQARATRVGGNAAIWGQRTMTL